MVCVWGGGGVGSFLNMFLSPFIYKPSPKSIKFDMKPIPYSYDLIQSMTSLEPTKPSHPMHWLQKNWCSLIKGSKRSSLTPCVMLQKSPCGSGKSNRTENQGFGFDLGLQSFGWYFKPRSHNNFPGQTADKDILWRGWILVCTSYYLIPVMKLDNQRIMLSKRFTIQTIFTCIASCYSSCSKKTNLTAALYTSWHLK